MSKKNKSQNLNPASAEMEDVSALSAENKAEEVKEETVSNKAEETSKTKKTEDKKSQNKKKDKKEKGKLKRKAKETMSELKKVTWPSFKEVCKRTGVVLVVVLIFAVVLFGIDYGLGALMSLLTKK